MRGVIMSRRVLAGRHFSPSDRLLFLTHDHEKITDYKQTNKQTSNNKRYLTRGKQNKANDGISHDRQENIETIKI